MKRLSGFSLMEMMIVLAIVAIVAAASAPMVNKKMVRALDENQSFWTKVNNTESIAYNFGGDGIDNNTVNIGGIAPNDTVTPRLFIESNGTNPHISFRNGESIFGLRFGDKSISLTNAAQDMGESSIAIGRGAQATQKNSIALGNSAKATIEGGTALGYNAEANKDIYATALGYNAKAIARGATALGYHANANYPYSLAANHATTDSSYSIALGYLASTDTNSERATVIGNDAKTKYGTMATAIGYSAQATNPNATAVGSKANAIDPDSIAIGFKSQAEGTDSIAIGTEAETSCGGTTAIGYQTRAKYMYSTAIGYGAQTTAEKQIVLGDRDTTVYIPGNLIVGKKTLLGANDGYVIVKPNNNGNFGVIRAGDFDGGDDNLRVQNPANETWSKPYVTSSDRRLKNVGEVFKAGLNEIKKLEVFNYTFKDDTSKTPRVGVIAQDLKKIFPNAVIKGEDGFLRIRMEDMFYALVNAVKELDLRISLLEKKEKQINELESQVNELTTQINNLEKRLTDLEKSK